MARFLYIIGAMWLFLPGTANAPQQAGPVVWVVPSMERVARTSDPGSLRQARLSAARGEVESFQIVVRSPQANLTVVDVGFSDLTSAGPGRIDASHLVLYREHYVEVIRSSPFWGGRNPPLGAGWYPDGLIPFRDPFTGRKLSGGRLTGLPFQLDPGRNQPVWVDIYVPRDAIPGEYRGTFTVTTDKGSASGEIVLRVWSFTLPLRPSLKSSFALRTATSRPAQEELLRNKVAPFLVDAAHERNLIDNFGLSLAGLGFWSEANIGNCSMSEPPAIAQLQAEARKHQPDLLLYNYTADEIDRCRNLNGSMKAWAKNLHAAGIQNLVTMKPTRELFEDGSGAHRSAVDIWVLLPIMFDQAADAVKEARQKGDEIWSYNTLAQDGYSPKWLIDYSPINFRLQPGFISQCLALTGILYWRADLWSAAPWRDVNNIGVFGDYNVPGEGMLVYPGEAVGIAGVAPSMRLKWIRDGIEDYEYVELLKSCGRGEWALRLVCSVARDWTNWSREPAALEEVRLQLGEELDRLGQSSCRTNGSSS